MTAIVDTNVLAELARPRPHPGVARWLREREVLHVSAITVEEIAYGLAWKPQPRIAGVLTRLIAEHCVVHPVTADVARRAGELRGRLQAMGHTRTQADMLIAATALTHGFAVATRNTSDFIGCGVAVLDPFDP